MRNKRQATRWSTLTALALGCVTAAFAGGQPPVHSPKAIAAGQPTYFYASDPKGSYLGVDVSDISKERAQALKLKDEHGVEITMVDRDAPAGKAGLKEHDVILEFNGQRVEGEEQLVRMIHETPAGRTVTLGISRDGQPVQLPVTLGSRAKVQVWGLGPMVAPRAPTMPPMPAMPSSPAIPSIPDFDMPEVNVMVRSYSVTAGMMVDNLTPQLGEFFGVKSGEGVLVRSVEKGSAAEAAGLKAGDVIIKVDSERVSDRSDWRRALRDRKSGKVSLGIVRDKREQSLTLTLPAPGPRDSSRLRPRNYRTDMDPQDMDDDDMDMDLDIDLDLPGIEQAVNIAPMLREQRLAMQQAQQQIELAQKNATVEISRRMKEMRPQIELELNQAQQQLREQMKQLEVELKVIRERI